MPSAIAVLVELIASSSASFLDFISLSAGLPMRITPTHQARLARPFCGSFLSYAPVVLAVSWDLLHTVVDRRALASAADDGRVVLAPPLPLLIAGQLVR